MPLTSNGDFYLADGVSEHASPALSLSEIQDILHENREITQSVLQKCSKITDRLKEDIQATLNTVPRNTVGFVSRETHISTYAAACRMLLQLQQGAQALNSCFPRLSEADRSVCAASAFTADASMREQLYSLFKRIKDTQNLIMQFGQVTVSAVAKQLNQGADLEHEGAAASPSAVLRTGSMLLSAIQTISVRFSAL